MDLRRSLFRALTDRSAPAIGPRPLLIAFATLKQNLFAFAYTTPNAVQAAMARPNARMSPVVVPAILFMT